MKLITLFLALSLTTLLYADDHEGGMHTPNVCIENSICAHLMFPKIPNTHEESQFIAHIMPDSEEAVIENFQAKLWMDMGNGHGHGSAPVKISTTDEAFHYQIKNAWFVMSGPWQIILTFKENGIERKIIIPVNIVK